MQSTEFLFRLVDVRADRVVLSPVNLPRSAASMSRAKKAARLQRLVAQEARLAAEKAELAVTMAQDSRSDSPDGEVSEFFVDELALVLNCSRAAATTLYEHARTLAERPPATFAALRAGALDWPRARAIATELGEPADESDPRIVGAVEAAVLPKAGELSIRRLRDVVRAELVARDAAAAERRRALARRNVDVTVRSLPDGMAELLSGHQAERAAAMRDAIDQYAWMAKKAGDERPIGVIRAEVHEALVLRPWENRPAVTARLDLAVPLSGLHDRTAGGSVGWVNGQPITAAHLRTLLAELDALGVRTPPAGALYIALLDTDGRLRATATRGELRHLGGTACSTHPDTGCSCPVIDLPPAVDRYRPTPAQRRFVTTRDRTCRHPGCGKPAGWADLDHVVAHGDGGETDCCNLCCLCRRHHRLKTHARGWRFVMDDDGTLHVTTPSGVTRTTRPPGLEPPAAADDPPPF